MKNTKESDERSGLVAAVEQWARGALKPKIVENDVASEKVRPSGRLGMACSSLHNGMSGFRFEKLLGEGHFGEVFHVEHEDLGGNYAMKTLKEVRCVEARSPGRFYECVHVFISYIHTHTFLTGPGISPQQISPPSRSSGRSCRPNPGTRHEKHHRTFHYQAACRTRTHSWSSCCRPWPAFPTGGRSQM